MEHLALSSRPVEPRALSDRQRDVLSVIEEYTSHFHEPPSVSFIARRLGLHHSTIQMHLESLQHKGWLAAPRPESFRRA